jgi:hypothetical protein
MNLLTALLPLLGEHCFGQFVTSPGWSMEMVVRAFSSGKAPLEASQHLFELGYACRISVEIDDIAVGFRH